MFLLTSCRVFVIGLLTFLMISGCVQNDPANFPDLADFPKEPIIVPSPEAQKQQQAVLRAAYSQGGSLAHPGMPNVLVKTTASCWLSQSQEIIQKILPILTSEPDIPIMIYISGTKPNHNNMLALGVRIENDLTRCGIDPNRFIIAIDFCGSLQDIQIQLAFAGLNNSVPLEIEEEEEVSDDTNLRSTSENTVSDSND